MFSRIITTEIYSKHVTSLNAETGALQFLREKPIQNWKKKNPNVEYGIRILCKILITLYFCLANSEMVWTV